MQRHDTAALAAVLPASRPPFDVGLSEPAALLRQAEATRAPLPPLTELCAGLDRDGAYAVRAINTRQRLGLREPPFCVLHQSMVVDHGGTVLSGEVIASRVGAGLIVVGRPVDATPEVLRSLRDKCLELYADGRRVALGLGAEVFGDPLEAVVWAARRLHAHGSALHPGELLLHRVCARRRPTDTGPFARRAVRHRPPARTDRHRPMNHQQGSGGAAMPPREPERSGSSGVHLNARRTTSPPGRRSARPIRPEEAQR
ncbi:MAG: hypothetical protein JF597_43725 [Streptomyces sp.]|uniref:hypothetical protein n=1 Tax=Streptomyces sp. TaxID=1931 RepID=UPI0025FB8A7F|nr:hypothetical protein [Streptomyces sp.]MBW8800241.1 hypothetical protein [Streptomyces sp.]